MRIHVYIFVDMYCMHLPVCVCQYCKVEQGATTPVELWVYLCVCVCVYIYVCISVCIIHIYVFWRVFILYSRARPIIVPLSMSVCV